MKRSTIKEDINLFTELVAAMCVHPEALQIRTTDFGGIIFTINPHPADYGAVLGKRARTLACLNNLAQALMKDYGKSAEVILEPRPRREQEAMKNTFKPKPDWDRDEIERLALSLFRSIIGGTTKVDFIQISEARTGMMLIVPQYFEQEIQYAVETILDCIAAKHGQHIKFRWELLRDQ